MIPMTRVSRQLLAICLLSAPLTATAQNKSTEITPSRQRALSRGKPSGLDRLLEEGGDLESVRTQLARVLTISNEENRQRQLTRIARIVSTLGARSKDAAFRVELLKLQTHIHAERHDSANTSKAAQRLYAQLQMSSSPETLDSAVMDLAIRWRNTRQFDAALALLRAVQPPLAMSDIAARRNILIGDLLLSKAHSDQEFDEAIEHYSQVADAYRESFPDAADDARLRQAKTLWMSHRRDEALSIFGELVESGNEVVADTARHYQLLVKKQSAGSSTAEPPGN